VFLFSYTWILQGMKNYYLELFRGRKLGKGGVGKIKCAETDRAALNK